MAAIVSLLRVTNHKIEVDDDSVDLVFASELQNFVAVNTYQCILCTQFVQISLFLGTKWKEKGHVFFIALVGAQEVL